MRNLALLAVAGDQVGDVVADHPAEPSALVALVGEVVADVGGGGDADFYVLRVAARFCSCVVDVAHGPLQNHGVRQLENEAVGLAPYGAQRLGAVARHPHVESAVPDPRDTDLRAVVVHLAAFGKLLDYVHRFFDLGEFSRLPAEDPLGGVAAPDAADRAISEHVVQGGEGRGRYGGVAGGRVRDEGADDHPLCRGEDLGVDDVGLLPEDVRVEGPGVGEAESLGPPGQLDDAPGWRVGLQGYAEVHVASLNPYLNPRPQWPRQGLCRPRQGRTVASTESSRPDFSVSASPQPCRRAARISCRYTTRRRRTWRRARLSASRLRPAPDPRTEAG